MHRMHRKLDPRCFGLTIASCALGLLSFQVMAIAQMGLHQYTLKRFDGSDIHYYLGRLESSSTQPMLVIMQGSDCNSVANHPRIQEFAEVAPTAAVLLVEKYGITDTLSWSDSAERSDCPKAYLRSNVPEQRVMDYAQVISELRRSSKWWNRKLIILGGSEGAVVAEQVAALVPETERLIILGFGGRRFEDDVLHSLRVSMAKEGLGEAAQQEQVTKMKGMFHAALMERSPHQFVSGYSQAWWGSMLSADQLAALRQVSIPVLALQGSDDQEVSVQGARELIKQLRSLGSTNIQYVEYPGLDHGFKDKNGTSHLGSVLGDIAKWLRELPKPQ